jgi:hypothetical protein
MNLDELAKLAESGDTEAMLALTDEPDVAADPSPEPVAVEPTPAEPAPELPVSTKAGDATIPYSVLQNARERAAELARENELLKAQLATKEVEVPAVTDTTDTKIADLRARAANLAEDFPELAASLEQNADLLSAMREQLATLMQEREQGQERQAAQVKDTVQEAIDAVPELSMWQSHHPDVFAEAVEFDTMLRAKPEWQGKPMADRFAKVVQMVQVMRPEAPTPPKAAAAASTPSRPRAPSLSDIPGGMAPSTSLSEQVDQLSASALGNKFMSMTPEQISEYLATM